MNPHTQRLLRNKNPPLDKVRFCVHVLCSAYDVRKWQIRMESSVATYSNKVAEAIEKCADEGAKIIMCSQHPRSFQLMKKLVQEIDRCDLALRFNCARAHDLIDMADVRIMDAPVFKQKLDQVISNMRHPRMPDISFLLKAVGIRKCNKRMRAPHPCEK